PDLRGDERDPHARHRRGDYRARGVQVTLGADFARLVRVDRVRWQCLGPGQRKDVVDGPYPDELAGGVEFCRGLWLDRRPVRTEDIRAGVIHDSKDVNRTRGLEHAGQDLRIELSDPLDRTVV